MGIMTKTEKTRITTRTTTRTTTRIMTKTEKTRTARTTTRTMTRITTRTTTRTTIRIMTKTEKTRITTRTTTRTRTKIMTRTRRPVVDLTFSAISSAENDGKQTSLITVSKTNIIAYILLYAFMRLNPTLKYSMTISLKNLMITL